MNKRNIIVGETYAYRCHPSVECEPVVVVDVGGWDWGCRRPRSCNSSFHLVAFRRSDGISWFPCVVSSGSLRSTWDEYEADRAAERARGVVLNAARAARYEKMERARQMLTSAGFPPLSGAYRLTYDDPDEALRLAEFVRSMGEVSDKTRPLARIDELEDQLPPCDANCRWFEFDDQHQHGFSCMQRVDDSLGRGPVTGTGPCCRPGAYRPRAKLDEEVSDGNA